MNFTKNIKWQLALAALGVSLFMAGAVRAQEIDNTDFATPATSAGGSFNTPLADNTSSVANNGQNDVSVTQASIFSTSQQHDTNITSLPRTAGSLIALAVVLFISIMVWKRAGNRWEDTLTSQSSVSAKRNPFTNRNAQASHS